jgi:GNAT superfamily N-acetyltransferase
MGKSSRRHIGTPVVHPTATELVNGWGGPRGTTVRLARPADLDQIVALADMAGGPVEDQMQAGLKDSVAATALLRALQAGSKNPLIRQVTNVLKGAGPQPFVGMSMVLVAVQSDQVVGALYSLPPLNFISQLVNAGVPAPAAMMSSTAVAKIRALAVDPQARSLGIASHLLETAVQLYDRIGFYLLYGYFDLGSGLETFYSARGFQIMPIGQGVNMDPIVGYPATLDAGPGEQMFARWR